MSSSPHQPQLQGDRFVAVDIEATGMDPERDEIIEIALVVFDRTMILERFSTMVLPHGNISLDILRLTGIRTDELDDAPPFDEVRAAVRKILGALPVVGHSIDMDVAMLRAAGIAVPNRRFDTFLLGSLLVPDLSNYSLKSVAAALGVMFGDAHRALDDAEASARVFMKLLDRIDTFDPLTLEQAAGLTERAGWAEAALFRRASDRELPGPLFGAMARANDDERLPLEMRFLEQRERPEPIRRTGSVEPVDPDQVERLLSSGGAIEDVLQRYEPRPTQIAMARAVAQALNEDGQLMVEAGTGTGKSMAYLLPAALFAQERGERVVISTDTLALQDQLFRKDLPDVKTALATAGDDAELNVAVMKGRANYLCLRQWFQHQRQSVSSPADAQLRAKILLWIGQTDTGDKAELRLTPEDESLWRTYAAEEEHCSPARCPFYQRNQCFLYRARREAEHAHVVIANHALVLSDAGAGSTALPDYERLILDEAHHLEDQATSHFGFSLDKRGLDEFCTQLVSSDGAVQSGALALGAVFLTRLKDARAIRESPKALELVHSAMEHATTFMTHTAQVYERLGELVRSEARGNPAYAASVRVTDSVRRRGEWVELELLWERIDHAFGQLLDVGRWFLDVLDALSLPDDPEDPDSTQRDAIMVELMAALRLGSEQQHRLAGVFGTPDAEMVYWIERSAQIGLISIHAAPLFVDELMQTHLFGKMRSTVLTSATLTTDNSFDFLAERLGVEDADRLALGSPFDHRQSTLVYATDDIPEPQHQGYQAALHRTLIELCAATEGRALVLFTSHAALQAAHRAIKGPLEAYDVIVLGQRLDGNPRQLIERLRTSPGTVVLGTASFWEGVDIVGDALSLLVITKLPFAVPSDPVFAARSELLDEPFLEYAVPQAVLKFKQGFGRLIRSSSDRGVCAVLDRRVVSRRYGSSFLQSLPPSRIHVGSSHDLPDVAARWLIENGHER